MNERLNSEAARRRIIFVPGEDFYFLAYTLFVLLKEVGATSPERALVDSRKLSYIADFIGGDSDLRLATTSASLSPSAQSRLSLLYDRAVARRVAVERLVEALAKRGLIRVTRRPDEVDHVELLPPIPIAALLNDPSIRRKERLSLLRKSVPHLRTMTLETLKQRLFGDRGVRTWGD